MKSGATKDFTAPKTFLHQKYKEHKNEQKKYKHYTNNRAKAQKLGGINTLFYITIKTKGNAYSYNTHRARK